MPNRKIENYHLSVTAGQSRDPSTHKPVPVNTEKPLHFETEHLSTDLYVRIQGFRNDDNLPTTSPYFSASPHSTNKDKYSISLSPLTFKNDVNGDDLVLGNDFDHPISKNLPPGFNIAWRVARWVVDPGLEGDPWAEKPWLEGRALGSVNVVDVGGRDTKNGNGVDVLSEGLSKVKVKNNEGVEEDIPQNSAARMKFFMSEEERKGFTFSAGEKYWLDFFNPYIDFNEFSLNLPGISIHILQYWDGQPLRYVLKNRVDQTVYLVVQFTLTPKDGVEGSDGKDDGGSESESESEEGSDEDIDEKEANEAVEKAKTHSGGNVTTSEDDVD